MPENGIGAFSSVDLLTAVQYYEGCSEFSVEASLRFGWCLRTGREIPVDFTIAAEFFKKAADLNNSDGINSFACCLEQGEVVDPDTDQAVSHYRRVAKQGHPDGIYNFGQRD
jgi:TPR repeat protein